MNTLRCKTCEEMGIPVEGMTGTCAKCHKEFCFGHLKQHGCLDPQAPPEDPMVPHVARAVLPPGWPDTPTWGKKIGIKAIEAKD
ncbi:MAG: hypothetical protein Q8P44_03910 [Dehalococcoidia bacterium]|nr:hypothetical protein [Dehalococcoidia bacterium]